MIKKKINAKNPKINPIWLRYDIPLNVFKRALKNSSKRLMIAEKTLKVNFFFFSSSIHLSFLEYRMSKNENPQSKFL